MTETRALHGIGVGPYGGTHETGGKTIATVRSYGVDARPTRVAPEDYVAPEHLGAGQQGGKCIKRMIELGLFNDDPDDYFNDEDDQSVVECPQKEVESTEDFVAQYLKSHPEFLLKFLGDVMTSTTRVDAPKIPAQSTDLDDDDVEPASSRDFSVYAETEDDIDSVDKGSLFGSEAESDIETEDDHGSYLSIHKQTGRGVRPDGHRPKAAVRAVNHKSGANRAINKRQKNGGGAIRKFHNSTPLVTDTRQGKATARSNPTVGTLEVDIESASAGVAHPRRRTSNERPTDNTDLIPFITPNLKLTTSIDHSVTNPTQFVRQHVPYPAPAAILDASEEMYWKNLEVADKKVAARNGAGRCGTDDSSTVQTGREALATIPWTIFEDDLVIGHMLDIRLDPNVLETEARFEEASKRLLYHNKIYRTKTSIKNMWNRVGRARSGFDERRRQGGAAATSMQGRMVGKMQKESKIMSGAGLVGKKRGRVDDEDAPKGIEIVRKSNAKAAEIDSASRAWMYGIRNKKARHRE